MFVELSPKASSLFVLKKSNNNNRTGVDSTNKDEKKVRQETPISDRQTRITDDTTEFDGIINESGNHTSGKQKSIKIIENLIEKSKENKEFGEQLKNAKIERELREFEERNGRLLRFNTIDQTKISENPEIEEIEENFERSITKEKDKVQKVYLTDEEFERYKENYYKRLETTDILNEKLTNRLKAEIYMWIEINSND